MSTILAPTAPAGWRAWLLTDTPRSATQARLGQAYGSWLAFRANPMALVGLAIVLLLILAAALAPWLAPQSPIAQDLAQRLQPPSAAHWLGTDELGRDIYSRIVWGSRITLTIVALVAVIVGPVGLLVGTVAGYAGGWLDTILMRVTDIFLAFPPLLLAILLVAVLGGGFSSAVLALAIAWWPFYAVLVRGQVVSVRRLPFIEAAHATGAPPLRIAWRHLLPNALGPLLVQATVDIGAVILVASGLSFIGLGPQPPTADWGLMIASGRQFVLSGSWWVAGFPGLAILVTALAFAMV